MAIRDRSCRYTRHSCGLQICWYMARREWLAKEIRKGDMYMADLLTEPRWQRGEGTLWEDLQLAAESIRAIVLDLQGEGLGNTSIALTTKHFPGGGATYKGFDPHYSYERNEVSLGGRTDKNLFPFQAAIDAGTSSIMTYSSLPKNTKYEEVAYAYNEGILTDLLRVKWVLKESLILIAGGNSEYSDRQK